MTLTYKETIDLNFIRREYDDSVFFEQNGYRDFETYLALGRYCIVWDCSNHQLRLYKDDQGVKVIESKEELEFLIKLLK